MLLLCCLILILPSILDDCRHNVAAHSTNFQRATLQDNKPSFKRLHDGKDWQHIGEKDPGSSIQATTVTRAIIRSVVGKYRLHSMIDAFSGLDIDPAVVEVNREAYRDHEQAKFEESNLATNPVPIGYDLVLCRDSLQHLPCEVGVDVLENLSKGQAKYLLIGSYDGTRNRDVEMDDYFDINLREYPYNLREGVLHVYHEYTNDNLQDPRAPEKLLLLFAGKFLVNADFDAMRANCRNPQ